MDAPGWQESWREIFRAAVMRRPETLAQAVAEAPQSTGFLAAGVSLTGLLVSRRYEVPLSAYDAYRLSEEIAKVEWWARVLTPMTADAVRSYLIATCDPGERERLDVETAVCLAGVCGAYLLTTETLPRESWREHLDRVWPLAIGESVRSTARAA